MKPNGSGASRPPAPSGNAPTPAVPPPASCSGRCASSPTQTLKPAGTLGYTSRLRRAQGRPQRSTSVSVWVGIIMGSSSDWETMRPAAEVLEALGVPHEVRVVSAHRTPDLLFEYAGSARERGLE